MPPVAFCAWSALKSDCFQFRPLIRRPAVPGWSYCCREIAIAPATIQTGIGGIPEAVLGLLRDRKDLGIHSEMVAGQRGGFDPVGSDHGRPQDGASAQSDHGVCAGHKLLFDFVDNNPIFEFRRTAYCNDPFLIAQNERMVAIN